ncbi:MAG: hypothetical protein GXP38_12160 [Chloroflexi bacterium]|nr:hypothetical protein [Chloroflexota bacterium]
MSLRPLHFIGEPIQVEFDQPPTFCKTPGCPDRFIWREQCWLVSELLQAWQDFGRRGRMATNMRPEHAQRARQRGSWGVGRFYFRVRCEDGRIFDLYYDRSPRQQREGEWFLFRELADTGE